MDILLKRSPLRACCEAAKTPEGNFLFCQDSLFFQFYGNADLFGLSRK